MRIKILALKTDLLSRSSTPHSHVDSDKLNLLGLTPHHVRFFLQTHTLMPMYGKSFLQCTACSDPVVDALAADPAAFLSRVLAVDGAKYIEQICGIEQLVMPECDAWDIEEGE